MSSGIALGTLLVTLPIFIKMHSSYFLIPPDYGSTSKKDITLSLGASEWLFHYDLWKDFNDKYKTSFEQYEEGCLDLDLIPDMITSLNNIRIYLIGYLDKEITFSYGWDDKREAIYCTINKSSLFDEISKLINLMEVALKIESDVYCQL